jgi:two-component system response regulator HydG
VTLIGQSPAFLEALQRLRQFSRVDSHTLLTGESGVGKELFARTLYLHSDRSDHAFICVNCAQYRSGDLLVSELFGHRKGSFTGAVQDRAGVFEAADGGVVFLDEIGELSPEAQAMLLRTLGEGEVKRVGDTATKYVDVRVVAATNRSLDEMVEKGTFRADLLYRLRTLHVHIPAVRERGDDVLALAHYLLRKVNRERSCRKTFSEAALAILCEHSWPGNVREMESTIRMSHCLSEKEVISPLHLRPVMRSSSRTDTVPNRVPSPAETHYDHMVEDGADFWKAVRQPFMDRELNRKQVQSIVRRGLKASGGSYKQLLQIFRVQDDDYLKFMDFLRHHRLKPRKSDES